MEIISRGIDIRDPKRKRWVYGTYHKHLPFTPAVTQEVKESEYRHLIIQDGFSDWCMPKTIECIDVIPESVGHYVGKKDINKKSVFSNDVVFGENYLYPFQDRRALPIYWDSTIGGYQLHVFNWDTIEVIGNLFENPDILNESKSNRIENKYEIKDQ